MGLDNSHARAYWASGSYWKAFKCELDVQRMQFGMLYNAVCVHPFGKTNMLGETNIQRVIRILEEWV